MIERGFLTNPGSG